MSFNKLISKHKGHIFRGQEKNPYEKWEDEKGKYIKMFTKLGSFLFDFGDLELVTKLKKEDGNVRNITWHFKKETNLKYRLGYYVRTQLNGDKKIYLHQHILKNSNDLTIDHIDRNPLNNRRYNLRHATKSQQSSNVTKRHRGCHASKHPKELDNIILPKYISYTKYKRNTKLGYYDMFIIQCHPVQNKKYGEKSKWLTKMSMDIPILKKLEQAINKLEEFDKKLKQINIFNKVLNEFKQHNQTAGNS